MGRPGIDTPARTYGRHTWLRSVIADLRSGRLAWSEQELLGMALGDAQAAQAGK